MSDFQIITMTIHSFVFEKPLFCLLAIEFTADLVHRGLSCTKKNYSYLQIPHD